MLTVWQYNNNSSDPLITFTMGKPVGLIKCHVARNSHIQPGKE